jgi:hypothetical protein
VTAAQELLAKVTPTTQVSVRTPRFVAGHAAYELVLAPKDAASTVKEVVIAVDAATGIPLDVRVSSARTDPAFEIGFTKIDLGKPAASQFVFAPPAGATVVEATSPTDLLGGGGGHHGDSAAKAPAPAADAAADPATPTASGTKVVGTSWTSVAIVSGQQVPSALDTLLRSAPTVAVGSHTARLITTSLVNALVIDDGRIVVGAVSAATLEAAAVAP